MNPQRFWLRRADLLRTRINTAAWFAAFLPWWIAAGIVACCAILWARGVGFRPDAAALSAAFAAAAGAAIAWWRCQPHRFSRRDALVRLEAALGLRNRLTSAADGVGTWPEPLPAADARLRWRWDRLALPPLLAAALPLAAWFIPLPRSEAAAPPPAEKPAAWADVERWTDTLKQERIADRSAIEKLREQLATLADRDPAKWYDHASLEAGDSLRQETRAGLEALERNLSKAADALDALSKFGDHISPEQRDALAQLAAEALAGLESGKIPFDPERLAELKKALDASKLKNIEPETFRQLVASIRKAASDCASCQGIGKRDMDSAAAAILGMHGDGTSNPAGDAGPGWGGGPAPLTRKKASDLGSRETEAVASEDLSRALPDDVIGLSIGEHETDDAARSTESGGTFSNPGTGGERAWQQQFDPAEQRVVERFFAPGYP